MPAVRLYHPLNTLKPFDDNIWIADGGEIRMAFPLGVKIPFSTRMTVVRLSDGGLWCHSPIAPRARIVRPNRRAGRSTASGVAQQNLLRPH